MKRPKTINDGNNKEKHSLFIPTPMPHQKKSELSINLDDELPSFSHKPEWKYCVKP